jgi:hypothetical protein
MWAFRLSGINSCDLPSILISLCQVEHDLHAVSKQDIQSALALTLVLALCSLLSCRNSLSDPFPAFRRLFPGQRKQFLIHNFNRNKYHAGARSLSSPVTGIYAYTAEIRV